MAIVPLPEAAQIAPNEATHTLTDWCAPAVRLTLAGRRWFVHPAFVEMLRANEHLLANALAGRAGRIVKHGRHRTVLALPHAVMPMYLKHYRAPDSRAKLNRWLLGPRAMREWRITREVLRRGIPTFRPVAWGLESPLAGDSYILTLAERQARQLDSMFIHDAIQSGVWLETRSSREERRELIRSTALLLARAHEAGIDHRDLHAGNILVQRAGDRPRLLLIDLLACRLVSGPLSWRRSWKNLCCLGISGLKYTTREERREFLAYYLNARPGLNLHACHVAEQLEQELWETARKAWWKRDEQCVRENRRFYFLWGERSHAHIVRDVPPDVADRYLAQPRNMTHQGEPLKCSPSSLVVRAHLRLGRGTRTVLWKEFRPKSCMDRIRGLLYRTPATRSWRGAQVLCVRGLPTPRAFMLIETCSGIWPDSSVLVTEYIPNSVTLASFLRSATSAREQISVTWRRELAERIASIVRYMHNCAISHRDLKLSNWLVVPDDTGRIGEMYIVDLAGVQVWRRLPRRRVIQNLARLWISARSVGNATCTDALRFLKAYLPEREYRTNWKRWWRKIERFAETKKRTNHANGRVLT